MRRQLRTERFDPSPKRPRRAALPRPGAAYNDTPVAPRVRRGGRAPVAILRPRQSQCAAVCQRPACRVPDARGASGKFGIHVISSFSSFLSLPTSTTPCVDVEPVRRSAASRCAASFCHQHTLLRGGMPYLSIRTHRLRLGPPDGGNHLPPATARPRHGCTGGADQALPHHAGRFI